MTLNKYFLLLSVALMAVSCQDKKELDPTPTPTPGNEVSFGGILEENSVSRTIYDTEVNDTRGHYFPINWVTDDKVIIASPDARENFRQGNFKVPSTANNRNWAGAFEKISGAIQWGSNGIHKFYSIYPQRAQDDNGGKYVVTTSDCETFNLRMPDLQTCEVSKTGDPVMKTADMNGCFMYAKKIFDPTKDEDKDMVVRLQYTPMSTALRFTLQGPEQEGETSTISLIRIIAPEGLAITGKFSVDLSGNEPVVAPSTVKGETSNIVTIQTKYEGSTEGFLELTYGQSIELNAFIIPQNSIEMGNVKDNNQWKIEVVTAKNNVLTKTIKVGSGLDTDKQALVAGQIHRLGSLPALPQETLDPSRWMEFIPRNVYLSEISIPGSWNSLNKDFQTMATSSEAGGSTTELISKKTIDKQYQAGCRLFHIDTRFRRIDPLSSDFTNLGIANGGDHATVIASGKEVMKKVACPLFSEALGYITANVKPQEYMVVVCTFAHNSHEGADWRQKVSDACASNTAVFNASTIDEKTTVGDVLGKVIVIVASETDIPAGSYSGSKCLFVTLPNTRTSDNYPSTAGYFDAQPIYHGGKASSGITLNCTQAQISSYNDSPIQTDDRGYAPTMDQRKTVGSNILTWAKNNYSNQSGYQHNQWMYQGLGGYKVTNKGASTQSGSYAAIANDLGAWISGKIGEMSATGDTRYYPVGLLLMNFANTNDTSKAAVNDILQLNNKFHKQYDPKKEPWPNKTSSTNSIVKKGKDAIGWD